MNFAKYALALPLVLAACRSTPKAEGPRYTQSEVDSQAHASLQKMFEEHYEAHLLLYPSAAQHTGDYRYNDRFENDLSDEHLAASKKLNDDFLARALMTDTASLSAKEKLQLAFFVDTRERTRQGEAIPQELLPMNQFYSRANNFAVQGSGESVHPFKSEKDYRDFIAKSAEFDQWVDSAIQRMSEGMTKGIVLPKVLIERVLPQLEAQYGSADLSKSTFYGPLKNIPTSITGDAKAALIKDYEAAIRDVIAPAYKKLHDFMAGDYLAKGRSEHGRSAIPGGAAWYQHLIQVHTTTNMGAEEIHTIGLAEVARIRKEMEGVRDTVKFKGDLKAFFAHLSSEEQYFFSSKEELIAAYEGLKAKIDAALPKYFDITPKTAYEVRPVEAFREKNAAGASYQAGSADGSRPGVFYINTYNLKAQPRWGIETLSLHEAAPGHHFQISIQQEMKDAPKFQRFSESTAFAEGWALYAESIGRELGLFTDPYQYFGRLSDELLRAMRLVLDTGLHAKGWTREQAIAYMLDNSAMAESDVTAEIERYMAIPGQALAYKIGQLKISELRRNAEEALGSRFDIRQFHNQVLLDGSLPMSILESKISDWIQSKN